jgi:RNA polymerase sigma-70 factor (ECF subfamily)
LVARARKGDQWASRELVGRYQPKAYAIAFHLAEGDGGEAEDLVQEAFLRAFRGLKGFRGRSSFHTWFHRIVVNTCLDGRRQRGRRERFISLWRSRRKNSGPSLEEAGEGSDRGPDHNPLAVLQSRELSEDVRRAMAGLPERQRLAFQLKVLQGMSIREIGEVMDAAEGTVKSHLFRATRSLREALEDWIQP